MDSNDKAKFDALLEAPIPGYTARRAPDPQVRAAETDSLKAMAQWASGVQAGG
jgi:hypothetical protein